MKVLLVLGALLAAASALPIEERINGENGWYVPQVDGSFKWMELKDVEELLSRGEQMEGRARNGVRFYLYTRSNPTDGKEIEAEASSVHDSHFNKDHGTRFVIHGWNGRYTDDMNTLITKSWLSKGDYNVIAVNWDRAQSIDYASSVLAVPASGEKVGEMINYLHEHHGMSLDSLEVIGHSLGAHVAGYAGKKVGGGRIHTIVGLDPALPLFSYNKPDKRLSRDDAFYVESIQTNGGKLGFLKPIGKGTFYPNGGKKQPGCGVDVTGSCSHGRSVLYYAEAVTEDNFGTIKCHDYEAAVSKECGSTYSSVRMGAVYNAYMVEGDFYVPVNSKEPFGKIE
ncbi:phospholipase A1-like [Drosophila guanche]|uniref:Blast:Pancreatic triacylglycerol lipase n=1 Tax=Drosophila guanche TaxID=7266 RepID=A0A3B0K6D1_DROGU|nr:phospholipase A1-like [Drosophila guanche]SPP80541.1 blast:Pancreatic triacylglycerol lipase [Drosophila guanche]